jgi:hypothetical protein
MFEFDTVNESIDFIQNLDKHILISNLVYPYQCSALHVIGQFLLPVF